MDLREDVDFFRKKFFFSGDDFVLDKEYEGIVSDLQVFFLVIIVVDYVCVKLNYFIQSGRVSRDKIF